MERSGPRAKKAKGEGAGHQGKEGRQQQGGGRGQGRRKKKEKEKEEGKQKKEGRVYDAMYRDETFPMTDASWATFVHTATTRFKQATAQLAASTHTQQSKDTNDKHSASDGVLQPDVPANVDEMLKLGGAVLDVKPPQPLQQLTSGNVADALKETQRFLWRLQYNHTGMQFFPVKKYLPLTRLMELGRLICRTCLPIKCLEAVIVALYLLLPFENLHRIPISFKSRFCGHTYQHIVLGVHVNGKFGALGLSRRQHLMYKPCRYNSLAALIREYEQRYEEVGHTLVRVRVGRPIPPSRHSTQAIPWRHLILVMKRLGEEDLRSACERYMRQLRTGTVESGVRVVRACKQRSSRKHSRPSAGRRKRKGGQQMASRHDDDGDDDDDDDDDYDGDDDEDEDEDDYDGDDDEDEDDNDSEEDSAYDKWEDADSDGDGDGDDTTTATARPAFEMRV
ncbi:hypothetical protein PTSG_07536 [Salpingoeca rosetta]|uniref:Vasohibin-1 n=1 Tax=Salpingoeca rosetta (strain ATCC 50818 / BSB-021) TaxID=946362 RepID=F2UH18_SALR5|nr:uncharacterized protein PTSG_07536 [Salpingoeca rosetta]EGD76417.1 hypothetical protein PTSG_07536 [Salpingoeca rosetta]|eukprot:XP_004991332.1 hypothetical protein PTSG_07536 [Salpingoeca rosetta]